MKKNSYLLSCLAIAVSSACHAEVLTYPDPLGSSQSDFGGTGLLQMPNARIAPEGEFSVNYRDNDQYRFYSTSVALFHGWKAPFVIRMCAHANIASGKISAAISHDKDKSFDF
ncbi:putative lipoprotein [Escherichia coli]|uniref:Putative lipoprotein n=1 Tax=Escherichia coli TaxID=562 RepID=A0A2X3LZZ9_ECOLX|nr:putative lipoprotein [Escherichia coli]